MDLQTLQDTVSALGCPPEFDSKTSHTESYNKRKQAGIHLKAFIVL